MSAKRQMRLGLSLTANGTHRSGWRHRDAGSGGSPDLAQWTRVVQAAERHAVHFCFWADGAGVRVAARDMETLSYSARIDMLDPLMLIAALSQHTRHVGFIATASTSFNEPYNIARKLATLDFLTGGRAGWNVVTSWSEAEARNFGHETHPEHSTRYRKAEEFLDIVTRLWDSFEDDAFLRDKETGRYIDTGKMHVLNHKGQHFAVRGPLNVPRPPQGHPIIAEAGSSEPGQELAARTADLVYTAQSSLESAQAFYASVKGRMPKYGRAPETLLIMPGILAVVGRTDAEAQEKFEYLQSLMLPAVGLSTIAQLFGDLSGYPLDGPVPDLDTETNAVKSVKAAWLERVRRENMTIRQLYQAFSVGNGHTFVVGSPKTVADVMEAWFTGGACDGMNVMAPYMPGGILDFLDLVVPELQRRGLFRTAYEGTTLRENLGLARPENWFASQRREQEKYAS